MSMKKIVLALGLSLSALAHAAPGVDEIIHKANMMTYYQGQDGKAKVKMTITDDQQRTRSREFTILRKDSPQSDSLEDNAYQGRQKFYIYFNRPADVNKMAYMVWKHLEADDDRWLYLPALDLVKRIAASDKRTSFVGSDFLYEDVSGRNLAADRHELMDTDDNYYILKNTPLDADSVEFSHYIMYIHKDSFLPVQVEYFDKGGEKYKVYTALKVETIQGRRTITQSEAKNLKTGSKTVMEYSNVSYDNGTKEDVFTERYLRKAPRELLR